MHWIIVLVDILLEYNWPSKSVNSIAIDSINHRVKLLLKNSSLPNTYRFFSLVIIPFTVHYNYLHSYITLILY
jgi:hypothetical protein